MAFGISEYKAYGIYTDEPITKRAIQTFECTITALAADVDLDIGDVAGTFWTAAAGTALGAKALVAFTDILTKVDKLSFWNSLEIEAGKTIVPTGGVGAGKCAVTANTAKTCPELLFAAGEGITSIKLVFQWTLKSEQRPTRSGF